MKRLTVRRTIRPDYPRHWLQLFADPPAPPPAPPTPPPTPPAPPNPPPTPPTPPTPPPDDTQTRIDAAAAAARKSAEGEAKKAADKLAVDLGYKDQADMLAQVKAAREKDMTEAQKEKLRADTAEAGKVSERTRADRIAANADIKLLAQTAGCDPDVAVAMIDRTNIKVDDEGTVTGVKEALEALKTTKPNLFGQAGAPSGVGGTAPGGGGGGDETPQAFAERFAKERAAQGGGVKFDLWHRGPKQ